MTYLLVMAGGAVGALARFLIGLSVPFPFGTLAVNVLGSFAMGLVWIWLEARGLDHHAPMIMAGLLGGFTTFSAFSLDVFKLAEEGRPELAGAYVIGSVGLSLAAIWIAVMLMRGMVQ